MIARSRLAPALLVAGALLVAREAVLPCAARADAIDDAVKSFEDYLKTSPDSQGIRNQVAELGLKKDPRVAKALLPLLRGNKYDDDVKISVAQCIGEQGDVSIVGALKSLADAKDIEKEKPKVLAALLEGIGDADAKRNYDFLMKIAKKQINENADIASAAFRAASLHVTRETVDDMVKELANADYVTTKDSAVKKAARNGTKPVLMEILKKITGQDIRDLKAWQNWWDENKKTWKPPTEGEGGGGGQDLTKLEVFKDSAYGFEIKKPNKAWMFRKNSGGGNLYLTLEALDEGQKAASVDLLLYDTKNYKSKTPTQAAQEWREQNEPKFRDFKEQVWERKCTYGGASAIEQVLVGQHKEDGAVHMHNVFVENGGIMFLLIGNFRSGKPASMKDDIEEILKSFKPTK